MRFIDGLYMYQSIGLKWMIMNFKKIAVEEVKYKFKVTGHSKM